MLIWPVKGDHLIEVILGYRVLAEAEQDEYRIHVAYRNKQRVLGALSRAAVLGAAGRVSPTQQSTASLLLELVDGVTHTLGEMLDGLLGRRST